MLCVLQESSGQVYLRYDSVAAAAAAVRALHSKFQSFARGMIIARFVSEDQYNAKFPETGWSNTTERQQLSSHQWECGVCCVRNPTRNSTSGPVLACAACTTLRPGFSSSSGPEFDSQGQLIYQRDRPFDPDGILNLDGQVNDMKRCQERYHVAQERVREDAANVRRAHVNAQNSGTMTSFKLVTNELLLQDRDVCREAFISASRALRLTLADLGLASWKDSVECQLLDNVDSLCGNIVDLFVALCDTTTPLLTWTEAPISGQSTGFGTAATGAASGGAPAAAESPTSAGVSPTNDEGAVVALGRAARCSHLYYCGRRLGRALTPRFSFSGGRPIAIPGSDGMCGPSNGPQCPSCKRYQTSVPSTKDIRQSTAESSGGDPVCSRGHTLQQDQRAHNSCDVCGVTGTVLRCSNGCDYDLCNACRKRWAALPFGTLSQCPGTQQGQFQPAPVARTAQGSTPAGTDSYQTIATGNFSPEELRLADYQNQREKAPAQAPRQAAADISASTPDLIVSGLGARWNFGNTDAHGSPQVSTDLHWAAQVGSPKALAEVLDIIKARRVLFGCKVRYVRKSSTTRRTNIDLGRLGSSSSQDCAIFDLNRRAVFHDCLSCLLETIPAGTVMIGKSTNSSDEKLERTEIKGQLFDTSRNLQSAGPMEQDSGKTEQFPILAEMRKSQRETTTQMSSGQSRTAEGKGNVSRGGFETLTAQFAECSCVMCMADRVSDKLRVQEYHHPGGLDVSFGLHMISILKKLRASIGQRVLPLHNIIDTLCQVAFYMEGDETEPEPEPEPELEPEPEPEQEHEPVTPSSSVFHFSARASPDVPARVRQPSPDLKNLRRHRASVAERVKFRPKTRQSTREKSSNERTSSMETIEKQLIDLRSAVLKLRASMDLMCTQQESNQQLSEQTNDAVSSARAVLFAQMSVLDAETGGDSDLMAASNAVGALNSAVAREAQLFNQRESKDQLENTFAVIKSVGKVRTMMEGLITQASVLIEEAETVEFQGTAETTTKMLKELQVEQKAARKAINRAQFDLSEAKLEDDVTAAAAAETQLAETRKDLSRIERNLRAEKAHLVRSARDFFPELEVEITDAHALGSLDDGRKKSHYSDLTSLLGGRHRCWTAMYGEEKVVLKEFNMGEASDRKKYEQEFKIQQQFRHPRLLRLHAAFVDESCIYAQFPFVPGGNLRQWLTCGDKQRSPTAVQRICFEIAAGMNYLHSKSILHCDLKQENVLIDADQLPLITDFETSRDVNAATATTVTNAGGTVGYLAPELTSGTGKSSSASDAYAFGVLWLNAMVVDTQLQSPAARYPLGPTCVKVGFGGLLLGQVQLLQQLLSLQPSRRPSIEEVMAAPAFAAPASDSATESLPETWVPMAPKENFQLVHLPADSTEYAQVAANFLQTAPECTVVGITRVQNRFLWESFRNERAQLTRKLGNAPTERQLWHGTRSLEPAQLLNSEEGFDHRCARDGLWGAGAYFATAAGYSKNYAHVTTIAVAQAKKEIKTDPPPNQRTEQRVQQIILARVLVGESVQLAHTDATRRLRRPPDKPAAKGTPRAGPKATGSPSGIAFAKESYDSVNGYTGGSQVFIVYSHGRAFPEYLITYL